MAAIPLQRDIYYPESDGKPMGETEVHREVIYDLIKALQRRYADASDLYVGGNLLIYYVEGDPEASVCPDVFVVKESHKGFREIYKLWEERVPCLAMEVTSKSSKSRELRQTKDIYEELGIEEYVRFNPLKNTREPRLQGFRLVDGRYQPVPLEADGSLLSRTTGLRMRREGWNLRLIDARTGEPLKWLAEILEAAQAAEEQARIARQEVRVARQETKTARQEAQAAEERARAAEEELARLRRELERARRKD